MLQSIAQRIFGSANDREIKRLQNIVAEINLVEPKFEKFSDENFFEKKIKFFDDSFFKVYLLFQENRLVPVSTCFRQNKPSNLRRYTF